MPLTSMTGALNVPGVLENPVGVFSGSGAVGSVWGSAAGALAGTPVNGLLGTVSGATGGLPIVGNLFPEGVADTAAGRQRPTWLPLGQATGSPADIQMPGGALNSLPINNVIPGFEGAVPGVPSQLGYGSREIPYGAAGSRLPDNIQGITYGPTQNLPYPGLVGGAVQGAGNAIPQYGGQVSHTIGGITDGLTGATQNTPNYGSIKGTTGQIPGSSQSGPIYGGWPVQVRSFFFIHQSINQNF